MINYPKPVWQWLHEELEVSAFEAWVYQNVPLLEEALGDEGARAIYELNFRDPAAVVALQDELLLAFQRSGVRGLADGTLACPCPLAMSKERLRPNVNVTPTDPELLARLPEKLRAQLTSKPISWMEVLRKRTP